MHAPSQGESLPKGELEPEAIQFLTGLLYGSISIASSLALFLVLYWALRLDSSITSVIANTYSTPLYFWPYVILTLGAIVLFGINVTLLVHRWRTFGPPRLKSEAGTGAGSLVAVAASACPVCGSTLLSALGIAGGLAAFPFQGLELKALSFALLALPIWLMRGERGELACGDGACALPKDHRFKATDRPWLIALVSLVIALSVISRNWLNSELMIANPFGQNRILNSNDNTLSDPNSSATGNEHLDEVAAKVLPAQGFQSKIALGESVLKLIQYGVIDREKFLAIYQDQGGLPPEFEDVLDKPSSEPILLTRNSANYYVNLLWPLGLANYMDSNESSPVRGESLFHFASTGGWSIGKEQNGGAYFNRFRIVELTPKQAALVTEIAKNTYRPCCNNSTFFQDCNHGSALLGLLQLGASQGLSEDELYREALAFNSFWFPHIYVQTALYFEVVRGTDWENVDPREVMGFDYSAIGPWSQNVRAELGKIPNLLPQNEGGASCGA